MSRNIKKKFTSKVGVKEDYFEFTQKSIKELGENTIVWMQVGSFYEMYVKYNTKTKEYIGSKMIEIAELCDGEIGEKKEYENGLQILMWGFPDASGEDYKDRIVKHGYNIVIYNQVKEKTTVLRRDLSEIVTPGTYISRYENEKSSNNLTCIIIKKYKDLITSREKFVIGYSNINNFTGRSQIFEYRSDNSKIDLTTFDELERQIVTNYPNEMLLFTDFNDNEYNSFAKSIGINDFKVKKYDFNSENYINSLKNKNINHMFNEIFGEDTLKLNEFSENVYATQSMYLLLSYVYKYNPLIIKNISLPMLNSCDDSVILANHTLKQLNIIEDGINVIKKSKTSSVSNFLNNCVTKIGSRSFVDIILNPSNDVEYLNNEYDMIDYFLNNEIPIDEIKQNLKRTYDIELIRRKMISNKATPLDMVKLNDTVFNMMEIFEKIENYEELYKYLKNDIIDDEIKVKDMFNLIFATINKYLCIDNCHFTKINNDMLKTIKGSFIIKKDYYLDHDKICDDFRENLDILNQIIFNLNRFCDIGSDDWFKIHSKEKSGHSIIITKSRSKKVLENIKNAENSDKKHLLIGNITINEKKYTFDIRDLKFTKSTSTNHEVDLKIIEDTCKKILLLKNKIIESTNVTFNDVVQTILQDNNENIDNLCKIISRLDVIQCKSFNSKKYNYCKPKIKKNDKSFVDIKDLRHVLIEQIQQDECYVPNDIYLGIEKFGMLLYGTNAVGKTSFIRSLGISLIMAQSGMFVPASEFIFYPYDSIYSRILGNDNLFKGLSTYMVEMQELRSIVKHSNKNSLVLGDELCSGTEQHSALSICAAGVKWLIENKSSFIFATHYHQLVEYKDINSELNLLIKHMSVKYDEESDILVYERKLKEGSGSSVYGLEVLKSLHMPSEFLKLCYDTRENLINLNVLDKPKSSQYNSTVLKPEMCSLCKKKEPTEVHHINEQAKADSNNFIGSINKNHGGNLVWLCYECHRKKQLEGNEKKIIRKVKTTKGIKLETQEGDYV